MIQNLEGAGFTMVPFGQGFASMSTPTKEFYRLLMEGQIIHAGHPVLRWMAGNVVIETDAAENMAGEFLGYAIYHDYDEYSRELGWVLKPAFWHKGYADEMTDLLTALARREGKNAVIECVPEQTASAHIARRHGFSYEGRADGCDVYRLRCEE